MIYIFFRKFKVTRTGTCTTRKEVADVQPLASVPAVLIFFSCTFASEILVFFSGAFTAVPIFLLQYIYHWSQNTTDRGTRWALKHFTSFEHFV